MPIWRLLAVALLVGLIILLIGVHALAASELGSCPVGPLLPSTSSSSSPSPALTYPEVW